MTPVFGATIKVITGFYLGCTGNLISQHDKYIDQFDVKLFCMYQKNGENTQAEIDAVLSNKEFEITSEPRK